MKILPDSMPGLRLSVAMIVRNEECVLADTLHSVHAIADQLVVLDTGSTDQTLSVARQSGATVGQWPWSDDFAKARNECLKLTDGDWVLWLDAGERLDAESAGELREFIDRRADRQHVYAILVEMPPGASGASAEQIMQPRLMPARANLQFEGRVRETLQPSMERAEMTIQPAPGRIVRHARQHDPARRVRKAGRDMRLAVIEAQEQGGWPLRLLLVAGEAYNALKSPEHAREAFRKAIKIAAPESVESLDAYYGLLATWAGQPFPDRELLNACVEALRAFPFDAQLLLTMGHCLQGRRRPELAVRAFEAAVKFGKINPAVWHLAWWRELAAVCLTRAQQLQDGLKEGKQEGKQKAAIPLPGLTDVLATIEDRMVRLDQGISSPGGETPAESAPSPHIQRETADRGQPTPERSK
jgi:tetratricopeptide (TPR) repeat protein